MLKNWFDFVGRGGGIHAVNKQEEGSEADCGIARHIAIKPFSITKDPSNGEATVRDADRRAGNQVLIQESALGANIAVRRMQLAVRDIRLARDAASLAKAVELLQENDKTTATQLDAALAVAVRPEVRERFTKIKALLTTARLPSSWVRSSPPSRTS